MIRKITVLFALASLLLVACSNKQRTEITADEAIRIAAAHARTKNFETDSTDIEVLKVKKGIERGPIRLLSVVRYFPKDMILNNEYWIVLFYPKGMLEKSDHLGGDFTALVDLHSGKILGSFAGM